METLGPLNEELLSDCCSAPVHQGATQDLCSQCKRLCYTSPKTLGINVNDSVGIKDVPPGQR